MNTNMCSFHMPQIVVIGTIVATRSVAIIMPKVIKAIGKPARNAENALTQKWSPGTEQTNTTSKSLPNPPPFEPKVCSVCGQHIFLSLGGYSHGPEGYTCEECLEKKNKAEEEIKFVEQSAWCLFFPAGRPLGTSLIEGRGEKTAQP